MTLSADKIGPATNMSATPSVRYYRPTQQVRTALKCDTLAW